jgi:hypothetical protein
LAQFRQRLGEGKSPIIGVVHLPPLPGSPGAVPLRDISLAARRDVEAWLAGGADGLIVENFGDRPFYPQSVPAITLAAMARVLADLRPHVDKPLGVNVLRNDATAALALATAFGLEFIRVNVHAGVAVSDQGLLEGRAHETLRQRQQWQAQTLILADLEVKHARPLAERDPVEQALELYERAAADAVLITGSQTGRPPAEELLPRLAREAPEVPVLPASGMDPAGIGASRDHAAGWIVGTWAKKAGCVTAPVDENRVRELVQARDS